MHQVIWICVIRTLSRLLVEDIIVKGAERGTHGVPSSPGDLLRREI